MFPLLEIDNVFKEPGKYSVEYLCDVFRLYLAAFCVGVCEVDGLDIPNTVKALASYSDEHCEELRAFSAACSDSVFGGVQKAVDSSVSVLEKLPRVERMRYKECLDASPFETWLKAYKAGVPVDDIIAGVWR